MGKTFLDEMVFSSEDSLSDFEFRQAYTNWITCIETISDPIVEQGWHAHHKHMVLDRDFLNWGPAWCSHDKMLQKCFMLKPFILYIFGPTYENQLD